MTQYSFNIVSNYDRAEMNNAVDQTKREISGRFDFKGSPANIDWLENKKGVKISGANEWQVESVVDIFRKKLVGRGISSKILDLSNEVNENNLVATKDVGFVEGFTQDKAKRVISIINALPWKVKAQNQDDSIRVSSSSKDDLQKTIMSIKQEDLPFVVSFINFR